MRKFIQHITLLLLFLGAGATAVESQAPTWTIFTTQTPTEVGDATPGWEVGTRFTTSKPGKVIGFRFWRAEGETGTNYGKLWTDSGTRLKMSNPFPSGAGWVQVNLDNPVSIAANTIYLVSVNTNTRQVKKGGAYVFDGVINNGPLFSDFGYYGQPVNAMPTGGSESMFFIDVVFQEDVPPPPKPNLIVALLQAAFYYNGQEVVGVRICNTGNADAGTSYMHMVWVVAPLPSGPAWTQRDSLYSTNAIPAGGCYDQFIPTQTFASACNQFHVWADYYNAVSESNENDNYLYLSYCRWPT